MTWTRDQTSELISLYKKFPNLYDAKHENYTNKRLREESLSKIRDKICLIRRNTSINDIKLKLKTIKSQYAKVKTLVRKSIERGDKDPENSRYVGNISENSSSTDDMHYIDCNDKNILNEDTTINYINDNSNATILTKELNLTDDDNLTDNECMEFEHLNEDNSNDIIETDDGISNDEAQISDSSHLANIRVSEVINTEIDFLKSEAKNWKPLETGISKNTEQSHLYYFMKSIETDLLALPDRLQNEAKWKIQDIVREAQTEHLRIGKNITISNNSHFHIDKNGKSISQEYKNLQYLSMQQILSSFNDFKNIFDELFFNFMAYESDVVPKIKGLNHLAIVNMLSKDKLSRMVKFLQTHYETSEVVIKNLLVPEWILSLYIKEYEVSRTTAIQELNKQEEIKSSNKNVTQTDYLPVSRETPHTAKPKIYKILQPIPKQNPSDSFSGEVISILILGEKKNSLVDTDMETSQNI